ncbi:vacuolar protein sorting protein VPS9 [Acrasis kona]|uniref:Vacuolar protein sorting protein VPS9 n=1 Tax=Acrasis kona TaxID=1008807 RepID=A0AAW2ZL52_9EUKA
MPKNLLEYEKDHNRLIIALRESKEHGSIMKFLKDKNATILVPHDQSMVLPENRMNVEFVQTHVIHANPEDGLHWTSMNGVKGCFSENYEVLSVLSGPPRGKDLMHFFENESAYLTKSDKKVEIKRIHVLRDSDIDINGTTYRIVLISEPIEYEGCDWSGPSLSAVTTPSTLRTMFSSGPSTPVNTAHEEDPPLASSSSYSTLKRSSSTLSVSSLAGSESDATDISCPPINFSSTKRPANALINELINMHNIPDNKLFSENERTQDKSKKFSFQDFVYKMRHKSAIGLVRKIKKFIFEINRDPYTDDVPNKVVSFLDEIAKEMSVHIQWKGAKEQELDNAREGIEKYVMTKIYSKVFSPTAQDQSQDHLLATRLSSFRKLKPEHLDIASELLTDSSCNQAVDELKKMNNYKTPRDKMICISNCCKIIFNILTRSNPKESPGADAFLPILIYLVMKANTPHLHSNLKYIMDFRNPEKMLSESGYFLTNLQSSAIFWETVDYTNLSINKQEYDKLINGQYFNDDEEEEKNLAPKNSVDQNEELEKATPVIVPDNYLFNKTIDYDDLKKIVDDFSHLNVNVNVDVDEIKIGELRGLFEQYVQFKKFFEQVSRLVEK